MKTTTITLEVPLKRGDNEIATITLHKPNSGHLRGVSLKDCFEMNTDAVVALVPRISDPQITPQEMIKFDASDLLQMASVIANFVLPPSLVAEAEASLKSRSE